MLLKSRNKSLSIGYTQISGELMSCCAHVFEAIPSGTGFRVDEPEPRHAVSESIRRTAQDGRFLFGFNELTWLVVTGTWLL
jgi:hypothetical protein